MEMIVELPLCQFINSIGAAPKMQVCVQMQCTEGRHKDLQ